MEERRWLFSLRHAVRPENMQCGSHREKRVLEFVGPPSKMEFSLRVIKYDITRQPGSKKSRMQPAGTGESGLVDVRDHQMLNGEAF